jgi:thymidine phosphorylase
VVTVGYDETVTVDATAPGTFTLTDATGATVVSVALGSGETASIPIDVPAGTELTATGPFAWNVVVRDGEYVTSLSPTRTTLDKLTIAVAQRRYVPVP